VLKAFSHRQSYRLKFWEHLSGVAFVWFATLHEWFVNGRNVKYDQRAIEANHNSIEIPAV
jgi:hypothetical protein